MIRDTIYLLRYYDIYKFNELYISNYEISLLINGSIVVDSTIARSFSVFTNFLDCFEHRIIFLG